MKQTDTKKGLGRILLSLVFIGSGILHFVKPDVYRKIMPPYLPYHNELVFISGVFEVIGGIAILIPKLRRAAAYGLVALLVAVYPANIHCALYPKQVAPNVPPILFWLRLPLQFVLMWWALWSTKEKNK
jgi:uncharacterized membrane protein